MTNDKLSLKELAIWLNRVIGNLEESSESLCQIIKQLNEHEKELKRK